MKHPGILFIALFSASAAFGAPVSTEVTVRAVSRDAKIIGTQVGGARITIRDVETGEMLASGIQKGGTGETGPIMVEPRRRGASIFATEGAAGFTATLQLARPTKVEISAEGPLDFPQSMQKVSKTMTLIPGEHVRGDGVILEIHGFNIALRAPEEASIAAGDVAVAIELRMTCSCPIEPGGMWDADAIAVRARLLDGDRVVRETALAFAGKVSTFAGTLADVPAGTYTLEITASDPEAANFGVYHHEIAVRKRGLPGR